MPPAMTPARDIPLLITSTASSSERRITPSWTIAHLKTKLEPVTGIPPSSQVLSLRLPDQQQDLPIQAEDEDATEIGTWPLLPYAEIKVQILCLSFFVAVFPPLYPQRMTSMHPTLTKPSEKRCPKTQGHQVEVSKNEMKMHPVQD